MVSNAEGAPSSHRSTPDYGLCCHVEARHHLETVFEHFTRRAFVNDGWDAHTFRDWDIDDIGNLLPKRHALGSSGE